MNDKPKFIVYAPRYRANSGGAIAMHKLCDTLNVLGYPSFLWPLWRPSSLLPETLGEAARTLAYLGSRLVNGGYRRNDNYNTPLANLGNVEDAIVVYPEIVSGNPLRAPRYVRWFLHKPGFHEGRFEYASGDLYFCYQESFNSAPSSMFFGGYLAVADAFLDIYQRKNFGDRNAVCYMVRKGKKRADLPDLRDKWVVDGYDHRRLAEVFNECKICYFYDLYTTYSSYAAACGCIPVIIPMPGVPMEGWMPEPGNRYGLAYGEEQITYALATRELLMQNLKLVNEKNLESASRFVSIVLQHFKC